MVGQGRWEKVEKERQGRDLVKHELPQVSKSLYHNGLAYHAQEFRFYLKCSGDSLKVKSSVIQFDLYYRTISLPSMYCVNLRE